MMLSPAKTKRASRQLIDVVQSIPAPTRGWNARDPIARMARGYAIYLENLFPGSSKVSSRKGATTWATGFPSAVKALVAYNKQDGAKQLFGATNSGIYDCTAAGTVGVASSVISNGAVLTTNYTTTGGTFLFVVNGTDSLRSYNGATWTVTATYSITSGGTLTTANIVNLNVFKRSLFFIEKGTMNFYYLPIDSIGGTVSRFPLGGLFNKGGHLVAMGTWTIDGGSGLDDLAVFITSEGQLAIYKGTDPATAATWALQGVFDLSSPLGAKCFMKYGGDLLYLSRDGLYPLSKALLSTTVNTKSAISDTISDAFSVASSVYGGTFGWQSIYSLKDGLLIVNVPVSALSSSVQFVMNTVNGAWCTFTGWNAFCWEILDDQLYMGMADTVAKAWIGANDFGNAITCTGKAAYDNLNLSMSKFIKMVRPLLGMQGRATVTIAIDTDYQASTDFGPTGPSAGTSAVFDTDRWVADGTVGAVWAGDAAPQLTWMTVATDPCFVAALRLRAIVNDSIVEWSATDFLLEGGGVLS